LFGTDRVNTIRDLRDKTVSIPEIESPHHVFVASMASYVGLDPGKDIRFVTQAPTEAVQHLAERKIDALMAFPPLSQELQARMITSNPKKIIAEGTDWRFWNELKKELKG